MTLIAIKIEEKFRNLNKAFLSFDIDNDQTITRHEFHKGIEGLRVKLPKKDIDLVFDTMDIDKDGCINYQEFCGFAEEKRRNIDPFDSLENQQRIAKSMGLTDAYLKTLSSNPYTNVAKISDIISRSNMSGYDSGRK